MGSKNCMNEACRATTSSDWKKGWGLKSGAFATLCVNCGSAYENFVFCETFHSEESGWRECKLCRKLIHCGCIASKSLYEFMDFGGIMCQSCCSKRLEIRPVLPIQVPSDIPKITLVANGIKDVHHVPVENRVNDDNKFSTERLMQLTKAIRVNDVASALEQHKRSELLVKPPVESSHRVPNLSQHFTTPSPLAKPDNRPKQVVKDMFESLSQPSLNFSLTTALGSPATVQSFSGGIIERNDQSKGSFQHGPKMRNNYPKPPKSSPVAGPETNKGQASQTRVARPPADGRGRNQLLPRYWPRVTDQELQQLSGDLKSNIVPLFEKILSASDAGRIGRLVLPKACAEAYFPAINQSEGIPIKIQDVTSKEWTFQFRFWPNNNSRMYVLEGVTPCIQNMNLQAGDTVIFSRSEPTGQLVIGCRKTAETDASMTSLPNGDSREGKQSDYHANGGKGLDDSRMTASEKKRARNIKNQRLHMHNDDAMELRITWDEAQELFRPPPSAEPTVVMVDGHEFEEFEEAPVFGKRTIFVSRPSGEQEQLAQCDKCLKWRRLPVNILLSSTWTCADNSSDLKRSSCSAPEEINPRDLDLSSINHDLKKRRVSEKPTKEDGEPSGLDALATAAALGDNLPDFAAESSSAGATTTRHPRHRPGCTCIVCSQPPSGKGKHEPTCKCNVCLTVRRRFKTLMMRKKKRQSEREAAAEVKEDAASNTKTEPDRKDAAAVSLPSAENGTNQISNAGNSENGAIRMEIDGAKKDGELDLNTDPGLNRVGLAALANMCSEQNESGGAGAGNVEAQPCGENGGEEGGGNVEQAKEG
ncbi:B3 domain-containing transcription repressor VAL1-like [Andrographis paniculata]|uniref:B3 domain-containing transcription repressor VAL1-like n=1 Tax=Andrographis paniculata TaxID=175694 RepID=UPI0021E7F38D|nr:B3 domain-containing transcription repressor VAL1-like [Andrographis paniculata]